MKINIDRLEDDESLRAFRYHIRGIFEAVENVASLVTRLNDAYRHDADQYAETSSFLEVEALDHLGYHVKQLRKPLARLQRDAYAELAKSESNNKSRRTRSVSKPKAASPAKASKTARPPTR
jgi:hypothetical protein